MSFMKKSSVLIFALLIFLISFILFHIFGFCFFYKNFGITGLLLFLSFLSMVYSVLVMWWIYDDDVDNTKIRNS
jgi:hypothetical protein